jgi:transposase
MDDPRRTEARRLRLETRMSIAQLRERFGVGRDTMAEWLWGLPTPGWTRRPNAKDELREQAIDLRRGGCSVPVIAAELGVSKSTAYLWTRHLPLDASAEQAALRRARHMEHMRESRWVPHRETRDAERAATNAMAQARVGVLSDREILILGAATYWCEGTKAKDWAPQRCRVTFINSDPALILLFLRFVELLGEDRTCVRYRISIHESADVDAVGRWWAELVGVPFEQFRRPTLKKHNPTTVRRNVGDQYRGCLVIDVPKSRRLYWMIEGVMGGIAVATNWPRGANI